MLYIWTCFPNMICVKMEFGWRNRVPITHFFGTFFNAAFPLPIFQAWLIVFKMVKFPTGKHISYNWFLIFWLQEIFIIFYIWFTFHYLDCNAPFHSTTNKTRLDGISGFRSKIIDEPINLMVIIRDSQTESLIPGASVEYFIENMGKKGNFTSVR